MSEYVRCPVEGCGKEVKIQGKSGHFNFSHKDLEYQDYKDQWEEIPISESQRAEREDQETVDVSKDSEEKSDSGSYQPEVKMNDEVEEIDDEPLYPRPKEPHEILQEICDEWGCTKKFKKFVTLRSKRREKSEGEGMNPEEFRYRLQRMNSGWDNPEEIRDIAEDYQYRLGEEMQKAREMDRPINYPLSGGGGRGSNDLRRPLSGSRGMRDNQGHDEGGDMRRMGTSREYNRRDDSYSQSRREPGRGYERSQREMHTSTPPQSRQQQQMSPEQIRQIMKEEQEQSKMDKLVEVLERQQEMIRELKEGGGTQSEIEKLRAEMEKEKTDQYMEYLKEKSERAEQTREKALEELKEEREKMLEQLEKQRQEYDETVESLLEEVQREAKKTGDYEADEYKFISEGMNRIADVMERRERPIKATFQGLKELEKMDRPIEEIPENREQVEGSRDIFDGIEDEFIEE